MSTFSDSWFNPPGFFEHPGGPLLLAHAGPLSDAHHHSAVNTEFSISHGSPKHRPMVVQDSRV